MTLYKAKQLPINLNSATKSDVRTQFAALCYRVTGNKLRVLLITTRRSGRWIIPRGWPMDNKTPSETALIEAWEEAGVKGKAQEQSLGLFSYHRDIGDDSEMPCVAVVYPVKVKSMSDDFPEQGQRQRKWVSPKKAAEMVVEPELAQIIRSFEPRKD